MKVNKMELKENIDNTDNVTPLLQVVSNPQGDDPNWLKYLKNGTTFLCRPKSTAYQLPFLGEYQIISTGAYKAICLLDVTQGNREIWVDSQRFSRDHTLFEILEEGEDG